MDSGGRVQIGELATERVRLRPLRPEDAETIQQIFPHWEVVKYLSHHVPWPYPPDGAAAFVKAEIELAANGEHYTWAITLASDSDSTLIGVISLLPHSKGDHRGFWLGQAYWGQGIMFEAARLVTDFAFEELNMQSLNLGNATANEGSRKLKLRAGATLVETTEENFVSGRMPSEKWVLTAEAWRANRTR